MDESSMTMPRPLRLHPPFAGPNDEVRIDDLPLIDNFLEDGGAIDVDAIGVDAIVVDAIVVDAIGVDATGVDAIGVDAIGVDTIGVDTIGVDAADAGDQIVSGDLISIDEYLEVAPELDADGWAVSSWQSYDWQGLAALGSFAEAPEREEADAEWSTTDWSPVASTARRTPATEAAYASAHPTADEVAVALDSIARKIRSGELSIDQFRGTPPEAALAAALAAMLRLRR